MLLMIKIYLFASHWIGVPVGDYASDKEIQGKDSEPNSINVQLWHVNYFEWKAIKILWANEKILKAFKLAALGETKMAA